MLLDRPDEFISGVGLDYTVNKHFQIIGEARSTMYVAGHTPNAFNNNPVDALGGVRIYPARWWGIGVAYRRHMNQQDAGHFNKTDSNTQINQLSGVFVPGGPILFLSGQGRVWSSRDFLAVVRRALRVPVKRRHAASLSLSGRRSQKIAG